MHERNANGVSFVGLRNIYVIFFRRRLIENVAAINTVPKFAVFTSVFLRIRCLYKEFRYELRTVVFTLRLRSLCVVVGCISHCVIYNSISQCSRAIVYIFSLGRWRCLLTSVNGKLSGDRKHYKTLSVPSPSPMSRSCP